MSERLEVEQMVPPQSAPEALSFHRWRAPPPADPLKRPEIREAASTRESNPAGHRSTRRVAEAIGEGYEADSLPLESGQPGDAGGEGGQGSAASRALSAEGGRCRVPPCIAVPSGSRTSDEDEPVAFEPVAVVRARAMFSPDPSQSDLVRALGSDRRARAGHSTVGFCVGTDGRVERVRTVHPFGGEPAVDAVCRDTVRRWRFRPMRAGGEAKVTCSEVTFAISFE